MHYLGIDTGGTFTDTVLVDELNGKITAVKTPTTEDLVTGIKNGIELACEQADVSVGDIDIFSHGNTIAVNALIERDGADTALITTEGFRDVLEIGEGFRDASLLYAPCGDQSEPLIPRRHRYEVSERTNAHGEERQPLDMDDVDSVIDRLAAEEIESVAVCLLHSYRNPDHEQELADRIQSCLPTVDISVSSSVSPKIREYSRTATTAVDAYVKPKVGSYLANLEDELQALGLTASINIMKSDGGVARPQIATKRPVTQTISGPVAGIKAAQRIGEQIGVDDIITFDMGGTSCDTSIIEGGSPTETAHREIQKMKVNGPFVNLDTIGAGGGSIAWLNDVGALRVGPKSSGANPGPACYGRGGTRPTVTDADLILGILNPDDFAGGEMDLDETAAETAISEYIAEPLNMSIEEAAVAIRDVIDDKMAAAVRATSIEEGYDPRNFWLMGFGGAGPMHAASIAAALDIERVVFPNHAGLTSAIGLLVSDIKHDYVRSFTRPAADANLDAVNEIIDELYEIGEEELRIEDVPSENQQFTVLFDMRYEGQAHNLTVPLGESDVTEESFERLLSDFEDIHGEKYDFTDDRQAIELVNIRITAEGLLDEPTLQVDTAVTETTDPQIGSRSVVVNEENRVEATCYDRSLLTPGEEVAGPAIVEAINSTIWLPPTTHARIDQYRNIIVEVGQQ